MKKNKANKHLVIATTKNSALLYICQIVLLPFKTKDSSFMVK